MASPSSPQRTIKSLPSINVDLLRNALKLLHQVQKERGYSLYCYADSKTFEKAMLNSRSITDVSTKFMVEKERQTIERNLSKIRRLIDSRDSAGDENLFHKIFVCFNALTSTLVHEHINPYVPGKFGNVRKRRNRTLSTDVNAKLSFFDQSNRSIDSDGTPNASVNLPQQEDTKVFDSDVQALLYLMRIFVQLKESAGVERAILSSLVLFQSQKEDSLLRMLQTDLILQVENQRSLVAQLEQLRPGPHRNLVLELVQLSPRLKELQTVILNDFEALSAQNFDAESLWDLLTEYINKLHSVELLIVEDLELSLPRNSITPVINTMHLISPKIITSQAKKAVDETSLILTQFVREASSLLSESSTLDLNSLLSKVTAMSAIEVKESLLTALNEELGKDTPLTATTDSVEESGKLLLVDTPRTTNQNENLRNIVKSTSQAYSKEWEISIYEIKFSRRIGQGASATTYLASWLGQKVAVKVASITEFGLEGWRREVGALQRLHHPNVIRLLGSVEHQNPLTYCLVLEFCNAGDLNSALKYPTPKNFFFHVALSIANAMSYLHSRHIIHRDLKPGNVLCHGNIASGNFSVKVTDFGVAAEDFGASAEAGGSIVDNMNSGGTPLGGDLTGETGTYRWMAPEVIRHDPYSVKADVYSFAVMLWQFVTHDEPFMDKDATEAANLVATEKARPPLPENTPKSIVDLISTNWSDNPSERWSFAKIGESLEEIKTSLTSEEKKWLEEPHGHPVYIYDEPELVEENKTLSFKEKGKKLSAISLLGNFFGMQKKVGKNRVK